MVIKNIYRWFKRVFIDTDILLYATIFLLFASVVIIFGFIK